MSIPVICDECFRRIRVRESAVGKKFRCKGCGHILVVPSSNTETGAIRHVGWMDRRNAGTSKRRSMLRGVSKPVKGLIRGLIALGVFQVLMGVFGLLAGSEWGVVAAWMTWGLLGITSGIMIGNRVPSGRGLGKVFAAPILLAFPLGTIIAVKILQELDSDATDDYLYG